MESNNGRGSLTNRYLTALLAPAVIAGVMQVTWPFFQHNPVLPYLLAVIFCAWYGGLGPGLLSVVISFLLTDFFFVEPYFFFWFPKQVDLVRLLLFAVVGPFISVMSELMHRARRRAEINLESAKRAERSVREKERFANQIAELSPVVINVLDLATRRDLYISPDVVNLLGYTPKEIAEMEDPFSVLWHPEDIPRASENLARLKHARDGEIAEFEYRIRRRDGEWRWVATRGISFERDEHGEVRQIVTATHDITERKLVERAQRESQRQYETLVQSIDGIVWEADPRTFTFTFVSKQAERILGYPLEQWFEGPSFWLDHMHPDDRDWTVAFCVDATDRRVDHQFEYRMIAADGHVIWLSDIVTVHVGDDQSVLLRGVMVDITERKRVEEKLRQSESQLAEAQHLANFGSWNRNLENNTLSWSHELYHIFGVQPSEFDPSYEAVMGFTHPQDRDLLRRVVESALKTHEPFSFYYRITRPDGEERIIHSRGNTISDISGTPIRMHGTAQDVTERKQAEDAVREAERKYRSIFENAGEGIFQSTPDGRFIAANPALARMHGFASPEELIHSRQDISRQLYVDPTRREEFKRQLEQQDAVRGFEYQVFRKDGSKIWISVNARAVRDEQGEIQYYEGTAQDITDSKRAEEALRESEERYRDLVENSLELICTHDLDGLILSANRAAMETMGYSSDSYPSGTNLREILAPEVRDLFDDYLKRIRADGVASGLMLIQTRTGEKRIWEYYNTLRTEGVAAPIVRGMARDITERKRAEEAMSDLRHELELTMNTMEEGVHRVDLKGNIVFENPAAARMLGWEFAELLGKRAHPTMHHTRQDGTAYPKEECPIYATFRDGVSRHVADEVFWRQDGTSFPVEYMTAPMRNDRNEIVAAVVTFRDITERKQAEEIVRSSEQRLRNVIDGLGPETFVGLMTPDGTLIEANKSALAAAGLKPGDVLGKPFEQTYWWAYSEPVQQQLRDAIERAARGEASRYDAQVRVAENQFIVIDFSLQPLRDETGKVVFLVPSANVITERKRAEDQLRQAKDFSENLIQTANVIILGLDVEGNINIFNQTAEEITGYTAAELKGRSWFETLVPRDRYPYVWEEFIRVAGGWMSPFENPILTKSGEERYIMWHNNQVRVDGKVVATISFGNDITERKRAEEALGQSEERFSKAFHSSPAALSIALLEDGRLLEVNAAFLRMTGYTREEVIGRTTGELGLWTSHYRRAMAEALHERGAVENLEIKFRKKSGEIRDGLLSAELIRLGAVPSILGIAQDVTERKRAEETLRSYSRQLIEAQEAERQHIARELHDQIGQVLTAIRINLQTIGNSCVTAESRPLIDQGVALIDAALEQVRDLSFELRPSLLDNLGLVAALRWYSDQYAKRTGIRTKSVTNLPEGQTRLSHELETACFRIVQEALTNVVRHANAKNVSIDLRRLDHKVVLSIKDDGIGFDELSANGGASATRLGLMGMKERALALGGTLKIESAPAQGTEIRAYFPTESKGD